MATAAPPRPPPSASTPEYASELLLRGAREVLIHHAGEVYRLRLTATGKLLLTK